MEILLKVGAVVILGLFCWVAHRMIRARRYFTVKLVNGEPKIVQGKATGAMIELIRDVASFNGITSGKIWGVEAPLGIRLEFSRSIPQPARQQMRNGWGVLRGKPGAISRRKR